MEIAASTRFLPELGPEVICQVIFGSEESPKALILKVGTVLVTETPSGIKIKPVKQVAISLGRLRGVQEEYLFDLDTGSARAFADKICAYCDELEAEKL